MFSFGKLAARHGLRLNSLVFTQKAFYVRDPNLVGCYDVVVVGGGIVGVATARELSKQYPNLSVGLLEKESSLAVHQSGNNSGVIHAGIYYKSGSNRALLCTRGMALLYQYLDEKKLPYKKVGKLIIATHKSELGRLEALMQRGLDNRVPDLQIVDSARLSRIEPNAKGLRAIYSPHTGIVDYALVTKSFAEDFKSLKGDIIHNFKVTELIPNLDTSLKDSKFYPVTVKAENGKFLNAAFVLCCAGLYADKLAMMTGGKQEPAIVPVRGEYLVLKPDKPLVKGNIYPVPDPRFPFLGVHFTPKLDGSVWLGPNAVLAYSREGYTYSTISLSELYESLKYQGTKTLINKYFKFGLQETMKSFRMGLQVQELQKFVPNLKIDDVERGPAGVRAQALSLDGELIEDFVFEGGDEKNPRILHCRNLPSPAATSSMAIAEVLVRKIAQIVLKK